MKSHSEQSQGKADGKDETYQWILIRSITMRFDCYSEDVKQISEQKDYLL
jgi:hypothetical protein